MIHIIIWRRCAQWVKRMTRIGLIGLAVASLLATGPAHVVQADYELPATPTDAQIETAQQDLVAYLTYTAKPCVCDPGLSAFDYKVCVAKCTLNTGRLGPEILSSTVTAIQTRKMHRQALLDPVKSNLVLVLFTKRVEYMDGVIATEYGLSQMAYRDGKYDFKLYARSFGGRTTDPQPRDGQRIRDEYLAEAIQTGGYLDGFLDQVSLEGKVTVGKKHAPLAFAPISLRQNGKEIATTFIKPDGTYQFNLQRPVEKLTLKITLEEILPDPPAFRVVYEDDPRTVNATTTPFDIPAGTDPTFAYNIDFTDSPDLVAGYSLYQDVLMDLGLIYYNTLQAYYEAGYRSQTLDLPTLTVRAFDQDNKDGAYWEGPQSDGANAGLDPTISLDIHNSLSVWYQNGTTIWHEFGHHVMTDAYDNLFPRDPADTNHDGAMNPSTTDSWAEGFASFYALLTQKDLAPKKQPSVLDFGDFSLNLEVNYRTTYGQYDALGSPTSREEFAVTSLLWDLIDPEDVEDCSPMGYNSTIGTYFKITPAAPIQDVKITEYCDAIQMDTQTLWNMLTANVAQVNPSPAAGGAYAHIFDMFQLYTVLQTNGAGKKITANGVSALDELFIAHGFFADNKPQNFSHDKDEVIGLTSHPAYKREEASFQERILRRSPPPLAKSFIGVTGQNTQNGQPVALTQFDVTVKFEAPYQLYNYTYQTHSVSDGQLYVEMPDLSYPTTVSILPAGEGIQASQSFEFSSSQYTDWVRQSTDGTFAKHTFAVDQAKPTAAPPLSIGGFELPSKTTLLYILAGLLVVTLLLMWIIARRKR